MTSQSLGIPAIGVATPLGIGKDTNAVALFAGSRAGLIQRDDLLPGRSLHVGAVTAALPSLPAALASWDCRNNRLMMVALQEIADDVRLAAERYGRHRIGVIMGTSTGGIAEGEAAFAAYQRNGEWPAGFHYRHQEAGSLGRFAATALDLAGPAYTVVTACSSSGKVFASARRLIRAGVIDAAVVGGADTLCRMTIGGFSALEAVATGHCNPFSVHRDGINIGEAAAAFLVTRDSAPVQLCGIGEGSDAHHISAPDPEGHGAAMVMRRALTDAGLAPGDIAYINLHGTGTALNDAMESKAVQSVFGNGIACSSTKGMTGHTLGAAGACEAAFLWLTLHPDWNPKGFLPPHLWDGIADPALPRLALTAVGGSLPNYGAPAALISNSFAFGGSNLALLFARGGLP
ncbi:beta-ketoacyl-[acyl-carrier-protein] synthase family protein [Ferrovibrio terrae]|uniref:beta-ketoacyl-[acyl-carrier-protein] synthase family protein n=1 Tax=Ferrovibrio terrae TaxID=2594003 RepID=UPI003137A8DC